MGAATREAERTPLLGGLGGGATCHDLVQPAAPGTTPSLGRFKSTSKGPTPLRHHHTDEHGGTARRIAGVVAVILAAAAMFNVVTTPGVFDLSAGGGRASRGVTSRPPDPGAGPTSASLDAVSASPRGAIGRVHVHPVASSPLGRRDEAKDGGEMDGADGAIAASSEKTRVEVAGHVSAASSNHVDEVRRGAAEATLGAAPSVQDERETEKSVEEMAAGIEAAAEAATTRETEDGGQATEHALGSSDATVDGFEGEVAPGPEMEEVAPGPEMEEVALGPEVEEVAPGPEVEEVAPGPEKEEVAPGPEVEEVAPGPESTTLGAHSQIGAASNGDIFSKTWRVISAEVQRWTESDSTPSVAKEKPPKLQPHSTSRADFASLGADSSHMFDSFDPNVWYADDFDRAAATTSWAVARDKGWIMTADEFTNAILAHPNKYIVLQVNEGIGNRMRAIGAGKQLAHEKLRDLVIIWTRDATMEADVTRLLTPSFLRGSYLLTDIPSGFFDEGTQTRNAFSLMIDATTDEGKEKVAAELSSSEYSKWAGAVYIKSNSAQLRQTAQEVFFMESYMAHFQPSTEVTTIMKQVPFAGMTSNQLVSMHIRGGEDVDLPAELQRSDTERTVQAMGDSFRMTCSVESFLKAFGHQAVSDDAAIFVAADTPAVVDEVRQRLPGHKVYSIDRPDYCNYGYNKARSDECMQYAVADLFLLARNPGPLLRSKFSSFSEFASFYRSHTKSADVVANGCADRCGGADDKKVSNMLMTSSNRNIAAVRLLQSESAQTFANAAASGNSAVTSADIADQSLLDVDPVRGLVVCSNSDVVQNMVKEVMSEMLRATYDQRVNKGLSYPTVPFWLQSPANLEKMAEEHVGTKGIEDYATPLYVEGSPFELARVMMCKSTKLLLVDSAAQTFTDKCYDGRLHYDMRMTVAPTKDMIRNAVLQAAKHSISAQTNAATAESVASLGSQKMAVGAAASFMPKLGAAAATRAPFAAKLQKTVHSSRARVYFAMGVEGGGHHKANDASTLGQHGVSLCDTVAKSSQNTVSSKLLMNRDATSGKQLLRAADPSAAEIADRICAPRSEACPWFAGCALPGSNDGKAAPPIPEAHDQPQKAEQKLPAVKKLTAQQQKEQQEAEQARLERVKARQEARRVEAWNKLTPAQQREQELEEQARLLRVKNRQEMRQKRQQERDAAAAAAAAAANATRGANDDADSTPKVYQAGKEVNAAHAAIQMAESAGAELATLEATLGSRMVKSFPHLGSCDVLQMADGATVSGCEGSTRMFFRTIADRLGTRPPSALGAVTHSSSAIPPYVIALNPLISQEFSSAEGVSRASPVHGSLESYPSPMSDSGAMKFPQVQPMVAWAEAEKVDMTIAAMHRDPVEALSRGIFGTDSPASKDLTLHKVMDALSRQSAGYNEMARQLSGLSHAFYTCQGMDDGPVVKPSQESKESQTTSSDSTSDPKASLGQMVSRAMTIPKPQESARDVALRAAAEALGKSLRQRRALLGVDKKVAPKQTMEDRVRFAYNATRSAFWTAPKAPPGFAADVGSGTAVVDASMLDRVELLRRVEAAAGRALTAEEMMQYVSVENDAYAAYFAFRLGVCG